MASSSNRLLVVALDHIPLGIMRGWEQAEATLKQVVEGEPDYVIANFGILKRFSSILERTRTILRLDGSPSYLVEDWRRTTQWDLLYSVEDAIRLDAGGVIVNLVVGGVTEMPSVRVAARVASACLEKKLPLFVSAYLGSDAAVGNQCEMVAFSARLSAELGADFVNLASDGEASVLEYAASVCPVPLLLAGGTPGPIETSLRRATVAIKSGFAGICYGRSIWQSSNVVETMRQLRALLDHPEALGS